MLTSPIVFRSYRARSRAACSTSSSISNVVRIHQMLLHLASDDQSPFAQRCTMDERNPQRPTGRSKTQTAAALGHSTSRPCQSAPGAPRRVRPGDPELLRLPRALDKHDARAFLNTVEDDLAAVWCNVKVADDEACRQVGELVLCSGP